MVNMKRTAPRTCSWENCIAAAVIGSRCPKHHRIGLTLMEQGDQRRKLRRERKQKRKPK